MFVTSVSGAVHQSRWPGRVAREAVFYTLLFSNVLLFMFQRSRFSRSDPANQWLLPRALLNHFIEYAVWLCWTRVLLKTRYLVSTSTKEDHTVNICSCPALPPYGLGTPGAGGAVAGPETPGASHHQRRGGQEAYPAAYRQSAKGECYSSR